MELVLLLQTAQLVGPIPKAGAFRLLVLMPFQSVVPPSPDAIAGWMSNNSPSLPHLAVAAGPSGLVQSSSAAAFLKHPRTPTGMNGMDCQSEYFQHLMKRICTGQSDDVSFAGVAHTSNVYSQDNLTKAVVRTLNQGSNVMSMDFHPQQQDILLVGTNVGDISLWEGVLGIGTQMKALCVPDSIAPSTDDGMWTANSHGNATSVVKLRHNTPSLHGLGYTNSGLALLALNASAVHKLWKWQRSERNPSGKRSAVCIALSKNDSYVMSASSGKVSLFNMMTFKVMIMFMPPPPAATYLAFHPQDNNIIAIGMEDSTIQIYNIRVDELCMWSTDRWEKLKSRFIQAPAGRQSPLVGETRVQFHNDQTHLLVVHDSQISIYDSKLECSRSEIAGALDSALTGASLAPVQNSHSDQGKYSNWLSSGLAARKSGSAGSNPGCEWAISAAPDDFIYVIHDITCLATEVSGDYLVHVLRLLSSFSTEILVLVKQSILDGGKSLSTTLPLVINTIIEGLVEKAVEDLRQLKGITATYRMTNKPLPVRHSPYVSGVLRPLKARKTESSLLKIRQGAQRRAGASSDVSDHNVSDPDKICMQLFLDIQEYGRNLAALGVEAADIPAYRSLWQCVAPPDRQSVINF
ncbi:hypothetical protein Patl1_24425 [Pistacia atlantica]|uniref:Uncharacterized protein n=1 Tax=Pistacia atlantica TaxID=434234 RepID=A0ACC0ZZX9_9ROSI|nr:hypothetical protein Patl1_24425 [Pistacia atlantica]